MKVLDYKGILNYISKKEIVAYEHRANKALVKLLTKSGLGSEFTGWVEYPFNYDEEEFKRVIATSKKIRKNSKVLVVIGIGGSYLGAKAALDLLGPSQYEKSDHEVIFVGNTFSSEYTNEIIEYLKDKDFSINVISKSGTTTEPAVAFRIFKKLLKEKYPNDYNKRIFATTTLNKGALFNLASTEGYEMFTIPEDIGGRYSVLTSAGLLPLAYMGIDVRAIMRGAKQAFEKYTKTPFLRNDAMLYAVIRNLAYDKGKSVEILAIFEPRLHYFTEWYKQLFGESEGKQHKGLYPTSHLYTTDLHSLGQYVQDGARLFIQTFLNINKPKTDINVPVEEKDFDGINYLTSFSLDEINKVAQKGTMQAHIDGLVPSLEINLPEMNPKNFGFIAYFMMITCAISGYLLDVNPFDQEGVETYKTNMFKLLGKPGFNK